MLCDLPLSTAVSHARHTEVLQISPCGLTGHCAWLMISKNKIITIITVTIATTMTTVETLTVNNNNNNHPSSDNSSSNNKLLCW